MPEPTVDAIGHAVDKVSDLRADSPEELVSTLADAAGAVNEAATFVQNAATQAGQIAANPTGWLTSVGLGFLISVIEPLEDAVETVSGDGDGLRQASTEFDGTGRELDAATRQIVELADQTLAEWRGEAALAAKRAIAAAADDLAAAYLKSEAMAKILELSAMVMDVIEDVVKSLLSKFVNWLVMTWLPALASAAATFGGSTAAAGASTVVQAVLTTTEVTTQISKLCTVLETIADVLPRLGYELKKYEVGKTKYDKEDGWKTTLFKDKHARGVWEGKGEGKIPVGPGEVSATYDAKALGIGYEGELSYGTKGLKGEAKLEKFILKGEVEDKATLGPAEAKAKAEGLIGTEAKASATVNSDGAKLGAEVFAGAKLGVDASLEVGGIGAGYKAEALAGAGVAGDIQVGMQDGKFVVGAQLGEAVGLGAKGGGYISIDPVKVVETTAGLADSVNRGVDTAVDTAKKWGVDAKDMR